MKPLQLFAYAIANVMWGILLLSCNKKTPPPPVSNNPPVVDNNLFPVANAGRDTTIFLPVTEVPLDGTASYDPDGTITSYLWYNMNGAHGMIGNSQSAAATLSSPPPGVYQIELSVTDNGGRTSRDMVKVTVNPPQTFTSPYIQSNSEWFFPWYNTLTITNIYAYIPQNRPFRVFIQRDFDPAWVEVFPFSPNWNNNIYEYYIETNLNHAFYRYGSLYVFYYGPDTMDTPNIKIEF